MRSLITKAGKQLRVGVYARFSSDLQEERSIDDQIARCRDYVKLQPGWTIVDTYADRALTGATVEGRIEFQRMVDDARAGRIDAVLAEELNRYSRNLGDVCKFFDRLAHADVAVITVANGELDKTALALQGIMAEQFRKTLGNQVHRGMSGRAREGKIMGGRAYGYRPVPYKPGEREIVETEAAVVRRIFAETLAGASPRTIALGLNRDGIPAPRSAKWSGHAINGGLKGGILRNPVYKGVSAWNQHQTARDPDTGKITMRPKDAAEHVLAATPALAIVTELDWNGAQATLVKRGGNDAKHRPAQPYHLLSGLMRCGECGAAMVSCGGKNPGNPRVTCWNRKAKGATVCDNPTILKRDLEARILPALRTMLADPFLDAWVEGYVAERQAGEASARQERAGLEKRLGRIERELANFTRAIGAGGAGLATILTAVRALEAERATLTKKRDDQPADNVVTLNARAIVSIRKAIERAAVILAGGVVPPDTFPDVRKVIEAIEVFAGVDQDGKRKIEIRGVLGALVKTEESRGITAGSSVARSSHHNPRVVVAA